MRLAKRFSRRRLVWQFVLHFALQEVDFVVGRVEQPAIAIVQFGLGIGMRGGAVFHIRATSSGVSP